MVRTPTGSILALKDVESKTPAGVEGGARGLPPNPDTCGHQRVLTSAGERPPVGSVSSGPRQHRGERLLTRARRLRCSLRA